MIAAVCSPPSVDGFAARLLADTDCQSITLVERGYSALSAPGSSVSLALTALLTIAVAFYGYRLLLGRGLALADAITLTIRIGIVLLIATSWEAWQILAYQGLAQGPTEIASNMLVAMGSPPPLESLQRTLDRLAEASVGYRTRAGIASPLVGGPAAAAAVLNISAILLTLSTAGVLVATRVVQAILLAIAPAMAGFILFNGTRSIAQNWLGAIAAMALAPLFVLLIAAVEFAILTPMIGRLLAEQAAGTFENSSVMPIGLVSVVFLFAMAIALGAAGRIGRGIRLARRLPSLRTEPEQVRERTSITRTERRSFEAPVPNAVQALTQVARRDARLAPSPRAVFRDRASTVIRDTGGVSISAESSRSASTRIPSRSRVRSAPRRSRASARRDS